MQKILAIEYHRLPKREESLDATMKSFTMKHVNKCALSLRCVSRSGECVCCKVAFAWFDIAERIFLNRSLKSRKKQRQKQ